MTLPAEEFIHRFLQHAVPTGFQRIRYYGFLANCHRLANSLSFNSWPPLPPGRYRSSPTAATSALH
jgi:hypothetical protein